MASTFEFDDFEGKGKRKAPHCAACDEMLADALDGCLSDARQRWFDGHVSTCAGCSEMLADAQRGAAWLEMLKTPRPEPSAKLMERILAQTTGASAETLYQPRMVPAAAPMVAPLSVPANLLPFRPRRSTLWSHAIFEPRLAMTAAMAFFSIALTLNLTGVQLNHLNASQLKPENLKHTYYEASAGAARYYDNLRVVRVMESRVDDLREAAADSSGTPRTQPRNDPPDRPKANPGTPAAKPDAKPEEKSRPGPGVSRQAAPMSKPEATRTQGSIDTFRGRGETVASLRKIDRAGGLV